MSGGVLKFHVYTVEGQHVRIAGIARYVDVFWDGVIRDAGLDAPWTPLGRRIKDLGGADAVRFAVRHRGMGFGIACAALRELVRDESYEAAEPYSVLDDDHGADGDLDGGDEGLVAAYVPTARGTPFGSAEASAELQWALRRHFPTLAGWDAMTFLTTAFREMCVARSTTVAYCMVYNARKKKMVLKQADGAYEETTLTECAERVVPWFMDAVLNVLRMAVHREDETSARAYGLLRHVRRVVCVDGGRIVTAFDVLTGRAPMKKIQRLKLAGDHAALRKFAMHAMLESVDTDFIITYEKLKHMYPPGHPDAPDKKKHLKKCRDARARRDMDVLGPAAGEWFKDFVTKGVHTAR
jgi:hypothetical protein